MSMKSVVVLLGTLMALLVACGPAATTAPTQAPAAQPTTAPVVQPTTAQATAAAANTPVASTSGACKPGAAAAGAITLGAAVSLTGATSNEGKYTRDGYNFAIDTINAAGGVNVGGKCYTLAAKYYDDESVADTSAKLTEKLITEDKVAFLLGPYGSGPTRTASVISEKYKIPMVEANGAAEDIFNRGFKNVFGILSPGKMYLRGVIDMALAQDSTLKTVAILVENDVFALEVAGGAKEYAESKGMKVVYNEKYPSGTKDVASLVTVVKGLTPDIILGSGHLQDSILVTKTLKDLGVSPKVVAFSVGPATPEYRNSLAKDADYVYDGAQWTTAVKYTGDDVFKTADNYTKLFMAKFNYEPPYQSAESSAGVITYQKALEKAGSLDPQKVRDALAGLDFVSFYGQIKFDNRGINTFKPMAVEQLQTDGKKRTVWPPDVAEAKPQFPTPPWDKR